MVFFSGKLTRMLLTLWQQLLAYQDKDCKQLWWMLVFSQKASHQSWNSVLCQRLLRACGLYRKIGHKQPQWSPLLCSNSSVQELCPNLRLVYRSKSRTICVMVEVPRFTNGGAKICEHNSQLWNDSEHTFLCFFYLTHTMSLYIGMKMILSLWLAQVHTEVLFDIFGISFRRCSKLWIMWFLSTRTLSAPNRCDSDLSYKDSKYHSIVLKDSIGSSLMLPRQSKMSAKTQVLAFVISEALLHSELVALHVKSV